MIIVTNLDDTLNIAFLRVGFTIILGLAFS